MNWDQVQGNWRQWTGQLQQKWGKLTDDDVAKAAGRREELAGLLQERYGFVKDQANKELDAFVREVKE
jgi:uncharacterized protein YjbJ (UPF0337 family)